jgi:hypothetical protein
MTDTASLYYDYVIRGSSRRDFLDALSTEEDVMLTDDEKTIEQVRAEIAREMEESFDRLRRLIERIEKEREGKE